MSQATVERILDEIQALSEEDRVLLEQRLAELDEARWESEATKAREEARAAGIDQAHIDRTIEKLRYSDSR